MRIVNDFTGLLNELERDMSSVLENEVMREAEKEFLKVAAENIYSAYSPKYYADNQNPFSRHRRFGNGGIYDITHIITKKTGKLSLTMENDAPANTGNDQGKNAVMWVQSGLNVPARQFYDPLQNKIDDMAENVMYSALKGRGW